MRFEMKEAIYKHVCY